MILQSYTFAAMFNLSVKLLTTSKPAGIWMNTYTGWWRLTLNFRFIENKMKGGEDCSWGQVCVEWVSHMISELQNRVLSKVFDSTWDKSKNNSGSHWRLMQQVMLKCSSFHVYPLIHKASITCYWSAHHLFVTPPIQGNTEYKITVEMVLNCSFLSWLND